MEVAAELAQRRAPLRLERMPPAPRGRGRQFPAVVSSAAAFALRPLRRTSSASAVMTTASTQAVSDTSQHGNGGPLGIGRQFEVGAAVEYLSTSRGCWIAASVRGFDEATGTYTLDVHPAAPPARVRPKPDTILEAAAPAVDDVQAQGVCHDRDGVGVGSRADEVHEGTRSHSGPPPTLLPRGLRRTSMSPRQQLWPPAPQEGPSLTARPDIASSAVPSERVRSVDARSGNSAWSARTKEALQNHESARIGSRRWETDFVRQLKDLVSAAPGVCPGCPGATVEPAPPPRGNNIIRIDALPAAEVQSSSSSAAAQMRRSTSAPPLARPAAPVSVRQLPLPGVVRASVGPAACSSSSSGNTSTNSNRSNSRGNSNSNSSRNSNRNTNGSSSGNAAASARAAGRSTAPTLMPPKVPREGATRVDRGQGLRASSVADGVIPTITARAPDRRAPFSSARSGEDPSGLGASGGTTFVASAGGLAAASGLASVGGWLSLFGWTEFVVEAR
eukprot:TRINITY_DN4543_c3_g1_i1.p1 TRINITY_DN4543_c3_g1~~TRINITY_DN4543_c3_g1_i1.p1  ORF type:complete len:556 (-),score=99.21 TRINITY_DN4543_c3_g1_i1:74-1582(-)